MKNLILTFGLLLISSPFATAQAKDCNPEPPDGLNPVAAFSIFNSNYRTGDYTFALKYGRWMICAKPMEMGQYKGFKLNTQLDKFIKIYQELANSENDPTLKSSYIDTALMIFEDKLELFGQEPAEAFEIHQQKGRFYLQNYSIIDDGLAKAYMEFQKMFDIDAERATTAANGYYVDALLKNYISKGMNQEAQAIIDEASKYATGELASKLTDYQEDLLENPDDVIAYYTPIVEQEPNNVEALKKLADAYEEKDDRKNLDKITRRLYEINPTYDTALSLADIEKGNARYTEAAKFYKEALKYASTDDQKKEINLDIADAYISLEQLQTARTYVREALNIDPDYGLAYIKMATIYGGAVNKCVEDRKIEARDRVVYWLVIDYLNEAKRRDPSVANTVNNQLPTYTAVTPSTEDKFLRLKIENGEKIRIDSSLDSCYSWINETTTVR